VPKGKLLSLARLIINIYWKLLDVAISFCVLIVTKLNALKNESILNIEVFILVVNISLSPIASLNPFSPANFVALPLMPTLLALLTSLARL